MTRTVITVTLILACLAGPPLYGQTDSRERLLIGGVAVSGRFIVFSHAGDLWRVGMSGGTAERLTDGPAEDDFPVFSPNGLSVAFSRRGVEDWDVYVVGADGGEARRLTFNPEADIARAWGRDTASVLFMSHRDEEGVFRLYTIPFNGGFPRALAFPQGWDGSYSPDGLRLAYVPKAQPLELYGVEWRGYRGGLTSPIWIADIASGAIESIPRDNSNDREPMWVGDIVYFVSDRSGAYNLHAYNVNTRQITQLTDYESFGIEHAAAGGGFVVFVRDGGLHVFDPRTGTAQPVDVSVAGDSAQLQPRAATGERWIQSVAPGASADRLVVGARGDVLTFDVPTGEWQNHTRSSGAAERYPAVSPDGRWIAYFSDASGEYELHIRSTADGSVQRIPVELQSSFYRELTWSPNSRLIAFSDRRLTLWVADIETRGARRVATSPSSAQDLFNPAWSPDGEWLAYSMYEANRVSAIYLYNERRGRAFRATDARVHADHPVFDPNGRYLYFAASNTAGMSEFGWSLLSGIASRPLVSWRLHVMILRGGVPSPIYPVTGEPNPQADSMAAGPPQATGASRRERPPQRQGPPARPGPGPGGPAQGTGPVDPRGIEDRVVPLPLPERDYAALAPVAPGTLLVLVAEWPDGPHLGASPSRTLYRWQLSKPRELVKLAEDVSSFSLTTDREQILIRSGGKWAFIPALGETGAESTELDLSGLEIEFDPAAEWRQMYDEAWRLLRGYFYDPAYHGQNLSALETHFASYLPTISRRSDLNTLLSKALGQIGVSHLGVRGGDLVRPAGERERTGLLGADYELTEGRYRITRIYRSGHISAGNPLLQAPLDQPGIRVNEGDYLLAVDGVTIDGRRNLYSYFQGKALQPTSITVSAERDGKAPRTYTVIPLPGENTLRRMNWAERNRRLVEEESRGILGYVYIPSFSAQALELVFQQLLESTDRRGLIIDQRYNGGGITADYLIEWLRRKPLYYYTFRHGSILGVPTNAPPAAKVLLVNEFDASAAETFALMFKLGNLGKILGARTMGAGIGPYAFIPELIDGGHVTTPSRAAFDPAGSWGIENRGVEPDVEVAIMPTDWRADRDPQLAAAINTILQMIVDNPPLEVKRPESR